MYSNVTSYTNIIKGVSVRKHFNDYYSQVYAKIMRLQAQKTYNMNKCYQMLSDNKKKIKECRVRTQDIGSIVECIYTGQKSQIKQCTKREMWTERKLGTGLFHKEYNLLSLINTRMSL